MPSKKQSKATVPQFLFHELLGKELSEKLIAVVERSHQNASITKFFILDTQPQRQCIQLYRRSTEKSLNGAITAATDVIMATSQAIIRRESVTQDKLSKQTAKTMYHLDDLNALQTIERLVAQYGLMAHMGIRDHSYQFFLNRSRTGALLYRLINKVAVISGDPICTTFKYREMLEEFRQHCKSNHWSFAITAASSELAQIAKEMGWTTVHFARERILNAQNNPVLLGAEGKRIRTQCKQVMKSGTQLGIYCPVYKRDLDLETQITDIYDNWRAERNNARGCQAYVTVFEMFSFHRLMTFIYSQDSQGKIKGFAALRKMKNGYHIDPCLATADAPRGTVDLLLVSSMALLRETGVEPLALGVEPLDELGEVTGMSKALERVTKKCHKFISSELPLGGKKGFNNRFRPDEALEKQLYLIYPNSPSIKRSVTIAHFANISLQEAFKQRYKRQLVAKKQKLLQFIKSKLIPIMG